MVEGPRAVLAEEERSRLLALARTAVGGSLGGEGEPMVDRAGSGTEPRPSAGVFVSVLVDGELNGCVGTLEPEPLDAAVGRLARQAAFEDPRLPALTPDEYERMRIKISVLSPMETMAAHDQDALLERLRPRVDGLLVVAGWHRATFLPAVWESLPEPRTFLARLLEKAGLPSHPWPPTIQAFRYTAEEFG